MLYTGKLQTGHSFTVCRYTGNSRNHTVYRYTANSTHLCRIPSRCTHHIIIPYTGTRQRAHIYIERQQIANSTHLYHITAHCTQHKIIPYTGTLQTTQSYNLYRYTAKNTVIRIPVYFKRHKLFRIPVH